jgi:PIN domain nuclease of toxin-antitoxin system
MAGDVWVHDSSVVLAYLQKEPGADRAARLLAGAHISAANMLEVRSKLFDRGFDELVAEELVSTLPLTIHALTAEHARAAARLRPLTRRAGLSLGDRACLALALELGAKAATTDRAWADLDVGVNILVLR